MVLFVDLEGVLIQNSFKKRNHFFRHIILNEKVFHSIKEKNFEKIFIVCSQKGIEEGWLNEKLFDLEIEYIRLSLELFTHTSVYCRYFPYKKDISYLIKDIIEEFKLDEKNTMILDKISYKQNIL